jgi:hypothetical protein
VTTTSANPPPFDIAETPSVQVIEVDDNHDVDVHDTPPTVTDVRSGALAPRPEPRIVITAGSEEADS